nr:MAG TPA: hypothetical protein [Bacteriophage sp.]
MDYSSIFQMVMNIPWSNSPPFLLRILSKPH